MSQAVQNGAVLYRLQWSNGKVRKEKYFADKETARKVHAIVVDALPNDEWCKLSEMEDQGINGYVESNVLGVSYGIFEQNSDQRNSRSCKAQ